MKWEAVYQKKLIGMEEAVQRLPKRGVVIMGMAAMESQGFMSRVHEYADHFDFLRVISCLNMASYPFCEEQKYEGKFLNENWFYGPSNRMAAKKGYDLVTFIPNNLHQAGTNKIKALKDEGVPIIYWGPATPMQTKTGFFNIGLSNVYEMEVIEAADTVVMEVNEKIPWIHGDTQVHIDQVDFLVEHHREPPAIPSAEPGDVEKRIAAHIAELVPDGATLQIGIGGIPNAVAGMLKGKKHLGIHTEMFTESMIDLFENGTITNREKTLWPGKFICTFALGSRRMYDWLDNNPGVMILRGNYVNKPEVLGQNSLMHSINTAMSVDLTGQVSSEAIGPIQYSGTGGQLDTHRGAQLSAGGKGIIALKSTAKKGTISTIVPTLAAGTMVTVPRQDLDWVATEYGAVQLRGRTVAERARKLISIAHPDYRDELERAAREIGYLH
ncbi:MAG: acetyl-CoA hydrolase/transferase C-terminal domain-containing protein [Spirochaetaceae bacterium]|nr:acetyl-CoA hydrolase/transferase C-terminal domain-containing protein [Spirochaetaceae bacterium]MDT8298368.1 acetyl-CoA hydrolase/transferase C-terminal domain-containing protein [Spirochaetaceae bacterium]